MSIVMRRERPERLRRGDVVRVRDAAEILATLDADGCLEGVPFMPEMLRFVGRRLTVQAQVERACDTISRSSRVRRMPETVLLADTRCSGSAHGGCQARCLMYWKEAWLCRVDDAQQSQPTDGGGAAELESVARGATRTVRDGEEVYRCQATEYPRATQELGWWDVRSFLRELTSGNVGMFRFARTAVVIVVDEVRRRLGLGSNLPVRPSGDGKARVTLDLRPGELVRVRSRADIEATLDERCKNRGLSFDHEMVPYMGGTYRVLDRIERFIDERTGRMVELKSDCIALEGVVCSSYCSYGRWFCPRAIHSWWREAWLSRVDGGRVARGSAPSEPQQVNGGASEPQLEATSAAVRDR